MDVQVEILKVMVARLEDMDMDLTQGAYLETLSLLRGRLAPWLRLLGRSLQIMAVATRTVFARSLLAGT